MYESLDTVSRELVGAIPTATFNAQASSASIGQELRIPVTTVATVEDGGASDSEPSSNTNNLEKVSVTLDKWRTTKVTWTGEEQNSLGALTSPIMRDQYTQAIRSLVNEMEADCCNALLGGAVASGNIITTINPFASDLSDLTKARKILTDNGSPITDLNFVMNTQAGMNLRNLTQLQKVNEGGENTLLRQGVLGNLFGFNLRESAGFATHTAGSASGFLVNGDVAKGETVIAIDTGTGTFKAGDLVHFGEDVTHKYVVKESGATYLKLANELVKDVDDNSAVNVTSSYSGSVGFNRGGLLLATRVPYVPQGGDGAVDRTYITDPMTGITLEVAVWGKAYKNTMTFSAVWGTKNIKGEHSVALIA